MLEKYIASVLRLRWVVIVLTVVLVAIAAIGLQRIVVLSDYKSFIDPQYPGLVQLEQIEAIFTENHNLLIAVAPADGDVFTTRTITLIQELTARAWLLPYASRVDSITNYQHTEADGDDLTVGDLLPDYEPLSSVLLDRARKVSDREPALKHNLISDRHHVAVINLTFEIPDDAGVASLNYEIATAAGELVDEFRTRYPNTGFYISGMVTMDYSMGKYSKQDAVTLIPGMLALMAVILLAMTRSVSGVFGASCVVIFTGIGSMGLLGWGYMKIDPASAIAPIVIMTLAVADSIHIIEGMQNAMRMGLAKADAITQSLRDNFLPVFLTSLTTVMGVATFTFAEFPSMRRLGLAIAVGVIVAFILSITLLPAILSLLPMKVKAARAGSSWLARIGEITIRHYRVIVPVALVAALSLTALVPLNRFNDSPGALLATFTPEYKAVEFFEENVSGILKIDIAIFSDTPGAVNSPEYLATVENFANWLRGRKSVDHVASITDTFKRLNQNMHGDDPSWYKLPDEQDLAAQYLLLYEMSLPYGLDLNNQLDIEKSATRLTTIMSKTDSEDIVETKWAIEKWFSSNAPQLRVVVTGSNPMMAEISYLRFIPSMMKGGIIAILMVSFVLFFALRSLKLGFLGMLANILPMSMGYGLWYLLNGQVNFAVSSVAGVCLGVVVDFAVHFLSKYQRDRNAGNSVESAIRYAFSSTGRPLWTTMVVLVSGFWLLNLSPIAMNASMGYLTGIVIMLALAFDFLVLPALLMLFDKRGAER